jgi:hypothetical protein
VTDVGDAVVTEVLIRGTVGGLPLEQRAFQLVETDDDRQVRRWTWHRSHAEALAAAGKPRRPRTRSNPGFAGITARRRSLGGGQ